MDRSKAGRCPTLGSLFRILLGLCQKNKKKKNNDNNNNNVDDDISNVFKFTLAVKSINFKIY